MNNYLKAEQFQSEITKLDSWYKALEVVDNFFDTALYEDKSKELQMEELLKNYYAVEKVFTLFYKDYGSILEEIHMLGLKKNDTLKKNNSK